MALTLSARPLLCRWIGTLTLFYVIMHGVLYNVLWGTEGRHDWWKQATLWQGYLSPAAGNIAGLGALLIAGTALPYVRRHFYWVRILELRAQAAGECGPGDEVMAAATSQMEPIVPAFIPFCAMCVLAPSATL